MVVEGTIYTLLNRLRREGNSNMNYRLFTPTINGRK